jgi:tRNA-(ms[2]io[6]A)-hydroxylase
MNLAALLAPTPARWLEVACEQWQELLIDHASCEKKAASTALALIFAYPESERQSLALARLAREEIRHFEQVTRLMARVGVPFRRLQPSRYAAGLRAALHAHEPRRRVDLLLTGALIEARSCERFGLLQSRLPAYLGGFYGDLARAEARHCDLYLELAAEAAAVPGAASAVGDWRARVRELVAVEAELILSEDPQFRFHSGQPLRGARPRGSVSSS